MCGFARITGAGTAAPVNASLVRLVGNKYTRWCSQLRKIVAAQSVTSLSMPQMTAVGRMEHSDPRHLDGLLWDAVTAAQGLTVYL